MSSLDISEKGYINSEVLVSTDWVLENLNNPNIRIIESNEDQLLYHSGHIPGAVEVDWINDLNQPVRRDYLQKDQFEELASKIGITKDTTLVFYGDKNNWWAAYAFWIFNLFNHSNTKIMDGGRLKWEKEGKTLSKDKPQITPTQYKAPERDDTKIRAFRDQVLAHTNAKLPMIDVRSPDEYSGKKLHMDGYPNEGALRGGHIPGAKSVPWAMAINPEDGTFKTYNQLKAIYHDQAGLKQTDDVVAYCRIGERSSHTWFVLTYLMGFNKVRNYDGSWTEWGNLVNVPIER